MTADLKFHPAAAIFPLMEGEEFDALVADIKANALRFKIILHEGKILDGRNRYRAMLAAGHTPSKEHFSKYEPAIPSDTPLSYVIIANLHRRHLNAKQKRDVIAKLIKAQPEKSDRQIGKMAQVSKNTAKSVRDELEGRGQIDHVETRTDTKGRKQPARKGWSHEREKQHRAKRRGLNSEREKATKERLAREFAREDYFEQTEAEAKRLALKLVALDRDLARDLREILCIGGELQVMDALGHLLGSEGNGTAAEASADKRREQFAALDDGSDPGPIPECLRRAPKAAAS